MSGWQTRDPALVGLDPSSYTDGQVPVRDPAGGFVPGAGATLSDDAPAPVDGVADPGTSEAASRADHVHTLGVLDLIVLTSPDGTFWEVTVTDLGALTTTELAVLLSEAGDLMTTEGDGLLLTES